MRAGSTALAKEKFPIESPGNLPPPVERWRRGEVERNSATVQDSEGFVGDPYRAVDTLTILERKGSITSEMHHAGLMFHTDFITAGFEQLRAASFERVAQGSGRQNITGAQIDARNAIADALKSLGGASSPSGCCAWYILGVQCSIKQWAEREGWRDRPINIRVASGILIGTLGILSVKYELVGRS